MLMDTCKSSKLDYSDRYRNDALKLNNSFLYTKKQKGVYMRVRKMDTGRFALVKWDNEPVKKCLVIDVDLELRAVRVYDLKAKRTFSIWSTQVKQLGKFIK